MGKMKSTFLIIAALVLCFSGYSGADVLIDDMEGPKSNQAKSGGYWFFFLDTKSHEMGNTQLLIPSGYNFQFQSPGYQSEKSAHVKVRLGAGYRSPFIGMGMNLDRLKRWYNFNEVSSIEFVARGKGVFRVRLRDSYSVRHTPEENFFAVIHLTDEWKWYNLSKEDFTVRNHSHIAKNNLHYADVADSVCSLIFTSHSYQDRDAGTIVELQVDNIIIRGLDTIGMVHANAPARYKTAATSATQGTITKDYFDDERALDELEEYE